MRATSNGSSPKSAASTSSSTRSRRHRAPVGRCTRRRPMPSTATSGRCYRASSTSCASAAAFSQAAELRDKGVHVALLIVDAIIESEKTKAWLEDELPEKSASMEDVARAIEYLHKQSPRAWTHELQLTPALERWVP